MIHVLMRGTRADPAVPPKEAILRALPFFLMNHWGTRVLLLKPMDPCPKSRIEKKPDSNLIGLLTKLMPRHANPNIRAMTVVMYLWPRRSMKLPTKPINRPAVRVPKEYIPDTLDLLQPNSPI